MLDQVQAPDIAKRRSRAKFKKNDRRFGLKRKPCCAFKRWHLAPKERNAHILFASGLIAQDAQQFVVLQCEKYFTSIASIQHLVAKAGAHVDDKPFDNRGLLVLDHN